MSEDDLKAKEQELKEKELAQKSVEKRADVAVEVLRLRNWNAGDGEGWKDSGAVSQELLDAAEGYLKKFLSQET
jgi:hypothetical protein